MPTRILLTATLLLACGCAGRASSPFDGLDPAAARALARQIEQTREAELAADLQSAFAVRTPRNVLVLSGGDANGAFGCGVLRGWRDAPGGRPDFDIVTGVSTGALMATFAFLGESRDDDVLHDVYTQIRDSDIYSGPFVPGPPNALFDTKPLQRLIAKHVTADVVRRVAAAHRQGRRLYVATVDLDMGSVVIWPLSKIAADAVTNTATADLCELRLQRFRNVLLAAASIPVLFPPVEIDSGLHADAGLREAMFLRASMLGPTSAAEEGTPNGPTLRVHAIVNGKLRADPQVVSGNVVAIGIRSLSVYNDALLLFNLRDAAHVAARHTPACGFRWIAEPPELDAPATPSPFAAMFDPAVMSRIYDAGRGMGQSDQWQAGTPKLDEDR